MKIIPSGKTLAVVNMLVGALMTFGGVQEAVAYWGEQVVPVIMGSLGAAAGAAFFASGLALWRQRNYAQTLTAISCVGVFIVHVAAWQFRLLGVPAILFTIIYPVLVLLSLWRTRRNALPANHPNAASTHDDRKSGFLKRIAVSETV